MDFKEKMIDRKKLIDRELIRYLDSKSIYQQKIYESMRYSINAGGKRLRPILVLEACELVGGNIQDAIPFACAIEMIHTYSLIHDDLPAMDNDDFRRGKLTNHKIYGEGLAILAGDGLLNYAFEIMIEKIIEINNPNTIKAMHEISKASGVRGMIGGQVVDLLSEGKEIDKETLEFIHINKTSAMIEASIKAGALIGGATEGQYSVLSNYGKNIGLAFQIVDDILDVTGDEKKLGKKVGSDQDNNKATYPSIHGIEASKKFANELIRDSITDLDIFNDNADFLRKLSQYLEIREN